MNKKDNLLSFVQSLFKSLSAIIRLEDINGLVYPSNIKPIIDRHKIQIEYQSDLPYIISDPRINFIKNVLRILLFQTDIHDKTSHPPFAFRLKHLSDWLVPTTSSLFLAQLSWHCKTNCIFCYQRGNPPLLKGKKRISKEEIASRLEYYSPQNNKGLMGPPVFEGDEILNNPDIINILKKIKKKGQKEMILISTNGTSLTLKMVKALSQIKNIILIVSLNSANPKIRQWLMRDPSPQTAINSLSFLNKYKIPFIVSIVAWPGLPYSDIKRTIMFAGGYNACAVRINAPNHSRFFSSVNLFDPQTHLINLIKYFTPLSNKYSVPIFFSEQKFANSLIFKSFKIANEPRIIGTIINSPAHIALKPFDLILEINTRPVASIEEALLLLRAISTNRLKLKIKRSDNIFELDLIDSLKDSYPYTAVIKRFAPFGVLLTERYIALDDIRDIARQITLHEAKRVLILTSTHARPVIKYFLKIIGISNSQSAKIDVRAVKNIYFGGTITAGDLLTTKDFITAIKSYLHKNKADLILIPASPFTNWGRDITGCLNLDIERETGIPVEFIYNTHETLFGN